MWVRGRSIISNLVVPSLKTKILRAARRIPFSIASTVFSREITPFTPFTSATLSTLRPSRSITFAYSAFIFRVTRWLQLVGTLHAGQRSTVVSRPHLGQVVMGTVCAPHFSHRFRYVISWHPLHRRLPTSISMIPPSFWKSRSVLFASTSAVWADADWNERRLPPESPSGKSTCGGGFILRGLDFPGLPMRPPIRVPDLDLSRNPDRWVTRSRGFSGSCPFQTARFFRVSSRPRQAI